MRRRSCISSVHVTSPRRDAACATTGTPACHAARAATRRRCTASARCCPPAGGRRPAPGQARGRGTSTVAVHRLSVLWSGTARSSPSRPMTEPISPLVWRRASRNTARRVRGGQDGNAGIGRLPAPCRPRLGLPGRDRLLGEPHRQASAPAQAGIVIAPVRDLEPLPGDAVATVGVGFERHRASQVRRQWLSYYPGPLTRPIGGSMQQGHVCRHLHQRC